MRHQWLKEKDLISIQEKRLRALINHAYKNVLFYHDLFDSVGVKPQDFKSIKDLQKIPILTKEVIRNNYPEKILAKDVNIKNCFTKSTTGSTGMPLKVKFSPKELNYNAGINFFCLFEFGLRLTDKLVTIRHNDYSSDKKNVFKSLFQKMGIFWSKNISIFSPIETILADLISFRPDVIATYPSILLLLSQEIKKKNIVGINPRLILTSGETLRDYNRNKIREAFNSEIYSMYGAEEFGRIAFQCKENSVYHIISDSVIIEFVKDGINVEDGENGEMVVTSLFNYTMPLIRYNIGDIGSFTKEKCNCGRGLPIIKSIEGRTDDFLILPSGTKISPRAINVIENISGVSRYKTVQETKNRIVVHLVKGTNFSQKTINEIKKHIKVGCFGEDVEVEVKIVKEIPLEKRGKLRAVVSNVKE
jgi:phenylacetate-CoA ligase